MEWNGMEMEWNVNGNGTQPGHCGTRGIPKPNSEQTRYMSPQIEIISSSNLHKEWAFHRKCRVCVCQKMGSLKIHGFKIQARG